MTRIYVWLLFTVIVFASCHSLVEDEFDNYQQIPVMNGLLQADSTFRIQITFTANLSDASPTYVENALIVIESSMETPDTLTYTEKGWYVSPRIVKAGVDYSCKAIVIGYPPLSAHTTVPFPTEIGSILFTDLAGRGEDAEKISSVEFSITNNPDKLQFWEVKLVSDGMRRHLDFDTEEFVESFSSDNQPIYMLARQDTVLLHEANPLTLFSNKMMTGNSYKVKFYYNAYYTTFNSKETPYILLRTVDESYYKYLKQYDIYISASFSEIGKSPQKYPLYSNVKNGLGMFTGMSVSKKRLEIED